MIPHGKGIFLHHDCINVNILGVILQGITIGGNWAKRTWNLFLLFLPLLVNLQLLQNKILSFLKRTKKSIFLKESKNMIKIICFETSYRELFKSYEFRLQHIGFITLHWHLISDEKFYSCSFRHLLATWSQAHPHPWQRSYCNSCMHNLLIALYSIT